MDKWFYRMPTLGPITGHFAEWYNLSGKPPYQHRGVDGGLLGEQLFACAYGPVVSHTNYGAYGNSVCIKLESNPPLYALLGHMRDKPLVSIGDYVEPETQIGIVGATGEVTGPHWHWQVNINSQFSTNIADSIDPLTLLYSEEELDRLALAEMRIDAFGGILNQLTRLTCANGVVIPSGQTVFDILKLEADTRGMNQGQYLDDLNAALIKHINEQ